MRGYSLGEINRFAGQPVQPRRARIRIARITRRLRPPLRGEDPKNVGPTHSRGTLGLRQNAATGKKPSPENQRERPMPAIPSLPAGGPSQRSLYALSLADRSARHVKSVQRKLPPS